MGALNEFADGTRHMTNSKSSSLNNSDLPERRVTLRDIAQKVGMSHVTVSLALRNDPKISEKTRLMIQQIAKEMDYRPDPMLTSLARYRHSSRSKPNETVIAWVNLWDDPKKLRSYREFDLWWQGASEAAERMGYRIDEFTTQDMSAKRLADILKARGIRGILVPPYPDPPTIDLNAIPWDDFTVIQFGRHENQPPLHFVTSSQAANTVMAFEHIRAKGYNRIGFISKGASITRMFGAGFYWTQQYIPQKERLSMLSLNTELKEEQKDLISAWIQKEKPDSILTDIPTLPQLITELDYRIPEDIGLATTSIHDTPIDAGIDQNPKEIGRMGFITLVSMMQDYEHGIPDIQHEILVGGKWVDGSSLPDRS